MTFSFSRTRQLQAAFTLLFCALFLQAVLSFYSFFSSPTDENTFRNAPSRFMVVKNFHGTQTAKRNSIGGQPAGVQTPADSLIAGDLILSINNGVVKTMKDIHEAVDESPRDGIRFELLRPSQNQILTFMVKRSELKDDFLVLVPNYVIVTDVVRGGASDRAGMKIGDLILRINEQEFSSDIEADRILRLGQIGKSLKYDILRNNQFIELNIVLAKFGIQVSNLVFTLSGLVWLFIGFFIAVSRPNLFAARMIGSAFMFIGFLFAIQLIRRDTYLTPEVVIRSVMNAGAFFFGAAFYFHALHYFPIERPELIEKKWIVRGYYIASALALATTLLTNTPFGLAFIVIYPIFIAVKYRKSTPPEYRRFNRIIQWTAITVGVVLSVILFVFGSSFQTIGIGLFGIVLSFIPLSYLYTIGRYRLLDLNFRVRRNTQYSVVTFLWGAAVIYGLIWTFFRLPSLELPQANIVFTGTAIEINDAPELSSQRETSEHVMLMALALIITFTVLRVRRFGQKFIDKKYFRLQYDYRRASFELGEVLASTLSAEELARGLVQRLSGLMELKRVGVLFFRDEACCSCSSAHGFDGRHWQEFCVHRETELIAAIKQFNNEFRVDYLPSALKDEFHREGFHYGVPIRSKERLIGVLLVGEKQSETTFQQEDLAFLASTAKQASVAIENAFLYEELAEKERMKHELQIARRIQLDSLPQSTPTVNGLEISGTSVPAMEVGGDFFDYLTNHNGKFTVVIGDVSGKGTSAALYMSKVQGILRSLHGFDLSPKDLFNRANKLLCQDLEKRSFVTVLGAEFNTAQRTIIVSRAGHLPLWHFDALSGSVHKILPRGLGLGLNDASIFANEMEERTITYRSGDVFVFATDGVTEAHNETGDFGEERILEIIKAQHTHSANTIQNSLLQDLSAFAGDRIQHDDQTIVIVKAL
jgi:sigma-B regulation protein RsbU (phosphoserine phosphatase)